MRLFNGSFGGNAPQVGLMSNVKNTADRGRITSFLFLGISLALGALAWSPSCPMTTVGSVKVERGLASMVLPSVKETSDVDEILGTYPAYLNFVVDVTRETDFRDAQRLSALYQKLVKINPPGAARFLKGLRFEIVEKMELSGMNPAQATTRNPELRRWVTKFVKEWVREADENLFRSIALRASQRSKK